MVSPARSAMLGALVADAVSMPSHWYYDTKALDLDFPVIDRYLAPKSLHPDSILWRSKYVARNKSGDILHEQAKFWGRRGIHYHQFLLAGENTLNLQLGLELYLAIQEQGEYSSSHWLARYIEFMSDPKSHRDTYVEEYHRVFFDHFAQGIDPINCAIEDVHIGGLASIPFFLAALDEIGPAEDESVVSLIREHVALTHGGALTSNTAVAFVRILRSIAGGTGLRDAIEQDAVSWSSVGQFETWTNFDDRVVVGRHLTSACYLPDSFTAALYLSWKYHQDFSEGVIANARCGGDNCHRGVVVGALLAAANGVPDRWLNGLDALDRMPQLLQA